MRGLSDSVIPLHAGGNTNYISGHHIIKYMPKTGSGFMSFNMLVALVVLIPSSMLLMSFLEELGRLCPQAENTVIFAIITGCVVLLSLMNFMKVVLME